jgi:hypothetical protein
MPRLKICSVLFACCAVVFLIVADSGVNSSSQDLDDKT